MTKLMKWANLLLIFLTLLSYLSPFIKPESFWLISLLGLAYPWLLLSNFLFVIYWGIQKERYVFFSFISILVGWSYFTSLIGFNLSGNIPSSNSIHVASYNINALRPIWKIRDQKKRTIAKNNFQEYINKITFSDLLCLQEANKRTLNQLREPFEGYEFIDFFDERLSIAIISRFPIIKNGVIKFENSNSTNSCVWVDIKVFGNTVRVYNIHLQSNNISTTTEKMAIEGNLQKKETWRDIKRIITRYKDTAKMRAKQAEQIIDHMHACPYPVIACGDFNDTPLSYPYHIFSRDLQDSFKEKGQGIGTTYAGSIPALRIDYIFADQNFEILNHQIFKEIFSDHYPVVGTLKIKEK